MAVAIANGAAIDHHHAIEQIAVAFFCVLQSLQELAEERDMKRVDLRDFVHQFGDISMMGERMVRVRNANFAICPDARFTT